MFSASRIFLNSSHTLRLLEFLTSLTILLIAAIRRNYFPIYLNQNCAVHIQGAVEILNGGRPFIDYWDTNPPLMFYLNLPAVWVANQLHAPLEIAFHISVAILSVFIMCLLFMVLRCSDKSFEYLGVMLGLALMTANAGYDYGERDHLFFLMFFPLFIFRCLRWTQINRTNSPPIVPLAIVCGLFGGIAICIKPYFLLSLLIPELIWISTERKPRLLLQPEIFAIFVGGFLSACSVLMLPPEARSNFFGIIFPLMQAGYSALSCPLYTVVTLENCRMLGAFAIFTSLVAVVLRAKSRIFIPLLGLLLASYASFVLQQKGWNYHAIPMFGVVAVLFCMELVQVGRLAFLGWYFDKQITNADASALSSTYYCWAGKALVVCCVIGLFGTANALYKARQTWKSSTIFECVKPFEKVMQTQSAAGDTITFLSTTIDAFPSTIQLKRRFGSQYSALFWVSLLEKARKIHSMPVDQINSIEDDFVEKTIHDCQTRKPKLIFFRDKNNYSPVEFSMRELFEKHKFTSRCLSSYKKIDSVEEFDVYQRL